jgi:hypothetical protein
VSEGKGFDIEELVKEDRLMMGNFGEEFEQRLWLARRVAGASDRYSGESSWRMGFGSDKQSKKQENTSDSNEETPRTGKKSLNSHHVHLPPLTTNTYSGKPIGTKVTSVNSPTYLSPTIYSPFPERIKETSFLARRCHSKQVSLESIDGMMGPKGRKVSLSIDNENPMTPDDVVRKPETYVEYIKIEEGNLKSSGSERPYRRHIAAHSGSAKAVLDGSQKLEGFISGHGDSSPIQKSDVRPVLSSPTTPAKSIPSTALSNISSSVSTTSRSSGSTTQIASPSDPNAFRIPIAFHGLPVGTHMNRMIQVQQQEPPETDLPPPRSSRTQGIRTAQSPPSDQPTPPPKVRLRNARL